jgi:2,3-bisphosphoglycerate-dependent phosphoglycerate mutase
MTSLIIVRHGQSQWNLENRFTGEVDVELSPLGREEAQKAGKLLKSYNFELTFTSVLKRAIDTLNIILDVTGRRSIPVIKSAALNERNYGDLQGLNKIEVEKHYGEKEFLLWRRSFEVAPPSGESLKDTYNRVIPYYEKEIQPKLKEGINILVVAHGNSLRALMMYLERISPEEIPNISLPTAAPRMYEFDSLSALLKSYYIH